MFRKLKDLPSAIQKIVLIRIILGTIALTLSIVFIIFLRDFILTLPGLALTLFFYINAGLIFYDGTHNRIITVKGVCIEIERTKFRKAAKHILIAVGDKLVKLTVKRRLGRLSEGDDVVLYLSHKTAVYEYDGMLHICEYHTLEVQR